MPHFQGCCIGASEEAEEGLLWVSFPTALLPRAEQLEGRKKKKSGSPPIPSKLQEASLTPAAWSHFSRVLQRLRSVTHPFYVFLPVWSTSSTERNCEGRYIFNQPHLYPNGHHTLPRSDNSSSWEQFQPKLLINLADKRHRLYWWVSGRVFCLFVWCFC